MSAAPTVTFYHNPQCSKSRHALALLRERGVEPQVVHYLKYPPTVAELSLLLDQLGLSPLDVMRRSEPPFKDLKLGEPGRTREDLLAALAEHPILLERPIAVCNGRAVIGRPPERVLELL